jgi:hypothetical protein
MMMGKRMILEHDEGPHQVLRGLAGLDGIHEIISLAFA